MSTKIKDACLCGNLRFEASAEPLFQGFCQCLDCRKVGAGHYAAIGLPSQAVKVTGPSSKYVKRGDSGKETYLNFCPTCGCLAFDHGDAMPGITIVNAVRSTQYITGIGMPWSVRSDTFSQSRC